MELKGRKKEKLNNSNDLPKITFSGRSGISRPPRTPRPPKTGNATTGGSQNSRNRKWILKRILGRALGVVKSKQENIITVNYEEKKNDLECQIYLDTDNIELAEKFYENFKLVLKTIDFEVSKENDAIMGSWWKRFWVSSKDFTNKEIITRLEKIERGAELQYIDKVQSEVDLNTANAIGILLRETKDIAHFSSLVGSLLFAKTTIYGEAKIFAQTLTQEQLSILKENPTLLQRPFDLILKMEEEKNRVLLEDKKKLLEG
jgi:hypothetical protein